MGTRVVVAIVCGAVSLGNLLLGAGHARPTKFCMGHPATIVGTKADDTLSGTGGRDVIVALAGIDHVSGGGGNDIICLGSGGRPQNPDAATGEGGEDRIAGGKGADSIYTGGGQDLAKGGPGPDQLGGQDGDDRLLGQGGRDYMLGRDGNDLLKGGPGSDLFVEHFGNDTNRGGGDGRTGDFVSYYGAGGISLNLSRGRSAAYGAVDRLGGIENVHGSEKDDLIVGNAKANILIAFLGSDRLAGGKGSDCLNLSEGENSANGGKGYDFYSASGGLFAGCKRELFPGYAIDGLLGGGVTVDLEVGTTERNGEATELSSIEGAFGSFDADRLIGSAGENFLFGGPGGDVINGAQGDDELNGAGGQDSLDGGAGHDECLNGEIVLSCE